jgi:hypothetical protein
MQTHFSQMHEWLINCVSLMIQNIYLMKNLGLALLVIGIIMTLFTGFNVITRKKVVDLGAVEISRQEKTPIYWSPITGGILAAAGILLLVLSRSKSKS